MRNHIFIIPPAQSRIGLALAMVIVAVFGAWLNAKADEYCDDHQSKDESDS